MDHLHMFAKNDGTNEDMQLIEYWLHIAATAVITPSTWPERNSMRIVQQLELGYHQAGKSSHSSPTGDTSDLHSLYAYHTGWVIH